jgi:cysteine desulfurase family protein (TIGR01976 family)
MLDSPETAPPRDVFPIEAVRSSFPALRERDHFIFFDNAAGAQIPDGVLQAVTRHLVHSNVQRGGRYGKSREVDETLARARQSVALLLNARDPQEVAFGLNATSFMRLVSQAIGQDLDNRREFVVTDMDHEANIATWKDLERCGAALRWWRMREDGNLHPADLEPLLSRNTRLVACAVASNALGSIVDVAAVAQLAHAVGAEVFLDGVHYAPHGPLDVQAFDCDYLVCSGYKIFAPHMGFLWGRREALNRLATFREEFVPNQTPEKLEVGTGVYENLAGMDAAVQYLESLGTRLNGQASGAARRQKIESAMYAIRDYERSLSLELCQALLDCGATIYGIREPSRFASRVPTFCFNLGALPPRTVVEALARADIGARDGHMYSPRLMHRFGLQPESGAVRISLVHYNTASEIQQCRQVLASLPC